MINKYLEKIAKIHKLVKREMDADDIVGTILDTKDRISAVHTAHRDYREKLKRLHARRNGLPYPPSHRAHSTSTTIKNNYRSKQ